MSKSEQEGTATKRIYWVKTYLMSKMTRSTLTGAELYISSISLLLYPLPPPRFVWRHKWSRPFLAVIRGSDVIVNFIYADFGTTRSVNKVIKILRDLQRSSAPSTVIIRITQYFCVKGVLVERVIFHQPNCTIIWSVFSKTDWLSRGNDN